MACGVEEINLRGAGAERKEKVMWLFARKGFFSIVQHRDRPDILIVRARVAGDIEKYWPNAHVLVTEDSDYRFRALMPRRTVSEKIKEITETIDYDNFKNSIEDKDRRGLVYARIWSSMAMLQDLMANLRKKR